MGQQQAADLHDIMQRDKTELENGQRTPARVQETTGDGFSQLLPEEAEILLEQIDSPQASVRLWTLYRYATTLHLLTLCLSTFSALACGVCLSYMAVIFGCLAETFKAYFDDDITTDCLHDQLIDNVLVFVYLAALEFITAYAATLGFMYVGRKAADGIRENYLAACLRQNIAFHEYLGPSLIATRISQDTSVIQEGISESIGLTLTAIATFISALAISFCQHWKLTTILCSALCVLLAVVIVCAKLRISWMFKATAAYAFASSLADEALASTRTATAYNMQKALVERYTAALRAGSVYGFRSRLTSNIMLGSLFFMTSFIYALAFWQGSRFVVQGEIELQNVVVIVLSVVNASLALGNIANNVRSVVGSITVAARVFDVIDRKSPLDSENDSGVSLDYNSRPIEILLYHVKHIYPSTPEAVVLHDTSVAFAAGRKTALVGKPGSGKSTILGLLERFYQPVGGNIFIDGHDIRNVSLKSLRRQISLVTREPQLFSTTIYENIRHGLIGSRFEGEDEHFQQQLVFEAARMASAHHSIMHLKDNYATRLGVSGGLLSKSLRARIAIARAIVSDPKVLLLDEVTTGLDSAAERIVQEALETASVGRTTIIVASRLSTIRHADQIVVLDGGHVLEQGDHASLMQSKGGYYQLVETQRTRRVSPNASAPKCQPSRNRSNSAASQHISDFERAVDEAFSVRSEFTTASQPQPSNLVSGEPVFAKVDKENVKMQKTNQPSASHRFSTWTLLKIIFAFNRSDWCWMVLGIFFSVICGCSNPAQYALFGLQTDVLSEYPEFRNALSLRNRSDYLSEMLLVLGGIQVCSFFGQAACFAVCSERLISRARHAVFSAMLRQNVAFFDSKSNSPEALTSFLFSATNSVAGLSGQALGALFMLITTSVACITLSYIIGWRLAVVVASTIPVLLICGFLRHWALAIHNKKSRKYHQTSAIYATEATNAIHTIASLAREDHVLQIYRRFLKATSKAETRSAFLTAGLYAISQALLCCCMALGFWYGGTLIAEERLTMIQFFICFPTIIFGANAAGALISFAPDMGKAKEAAHELKTFLDLTPEIDTWSNEGHRLSSNPVYGGLVFEDVHFAYPTDSEQKILKGVNLEIRPGQSVAFVGDSSSGKSTAFSLLERFYDVNSGQIMLDGTPITNLNINEYRSYIALIEQDPMIYSGTILDNILFGIDPSRVSRAQVDSACRAANLYDFVSSLPDGYNTIVYHRACALSASQKQRIAIARALLRNPKILLLDEATSALDELEERLVMQALERASSGRTTVHISNRLANVRAADVVYVFDRGQVVECGSHDVLMALGARYAQLVAQGVVA